MHRASRSGGRSRLNGSALRRAHRAGAVGANPVPVHARVRGRGAPASSRLLDLGRVPSAQPALDQRDAPHRASIHRSPIFGCGTIGLNKAEAVVGFLAGSSLCATAIPLWWEPFLEQRRRSSFDFGVWLPLANEFNVRSTMRHHVPPLMIHASTTFNRGVNHAIEERTREAELVALDRAGAAGALAHARVAPAARHGLAAATSKYDAGSRSAPWMRSMVTARSSRGWRRPSTAARANSGNSSRNRTPLWASEISPGRGVEPPPISYLSTLFTIAPGDLIYSGTPAGVGAVHRGDVLEGGVDGGGTIQLKVV
jgi:hypothetical protein